MVRAAAVLFVCVVCGCGGAEAPAGGDGGPGSAVSGDAADAGAARRDGGTDEADVVPCLQASTFVGSGALEVRAATPADADRIGALRWERHGGCERLVIDLVDEDGRSAQRAGAVGAELLRDRGVLRISLRDVEWVDPDATDTELDGPLADAAYAVFSPEGRWVFVDVHLGSAAEAAVTTLDEPARVVVDLKPGGAALPGPAPRTTHVVVLQPRPGPATYPLTVTGYARTFEANVVVRLERNGTDVHEDFTTATAWADAWGHFKFTIPDGPSGDVRLHVGEHSARDGTWEGVALPLRMR